MLSNKDKIFREQDMEYFILEKEIQKFLMMQIVTHKKVKIFIFKFMSCGLNLEIH